MAKFKKRGTSREQLSTHLTTVVHTKEPSTPQTLHMQKTIESTLASPEPMQKEDCEGDGNEFDLSQILSDAGSEIDAIEFTCDQMNCSDTN